MPGDGVPRKGRIGAVRHLVSVLGAVDTGPWGGKLCVVGFL